METVCNGRDDDALGVTRPSARSVGHFWQESYGQLYPTLARLCADGLATVRDERVGGRQRKARAITGAGRLPPQAVYLASGALFGAVHFWGEPGGLAGVVAAGFLGWLLAKSIGETGGLGWAWFLHFLQDVVIFSALFAAAP